MTPQRMNQAQMNNPHPQTRKRKKKRQQVALQSRREEKKGRKRLSRDSNKFRLLLKRTRPH
jgi:hypothetical protein